MSQENDHDFRDQHKILVLEMLTNPCGGLVTKMLLHSVILISVVEQWSNIICVLFLSRECMIFIWWAVD